MYMLICGAYRLKPDKDVLRSWHMLFESEDGEYMQRAAMLIAKTPSHKVPTPADIIQTARQLQRRARMEAESPSAGKTQLGEMPTRDCLHPMMTRDGGWWVCRGCNVRVPYFRDGKEAIAYMRDQLNTIKDL